MFKNKTTKHVLITAVGVTLLAGCSATQQHDNNADELARYRQELANKEQEISRLQADLESERNAAGAVTAPVESINSDLFPPDPEPGHCYARVLTPATYTTKTEQVLVRGESETLAVTPAEYEWTEETVLVQEASSRLEVIPAEYEWVEERVLVKAASKKLVEVPAQFDQVQEQILETPARTEWKRSSSPIAGAIQTTLANDNSGEVLCLVEVPAVYKTVSKTVMVSPPRVEEVIIPAEYDTVRKQVVKRPAQTREVVIPAKYETVRVQKLVRDAREIRNTVPAEYRTVTQRVKVTDEELEWSDVVCDINLTRELAVDMQQRLKDLGYYSGPIDGIFGTQTMSAVNRYAKAEGLAQSNSYIPTDTIRKMGLNI